MKIFRRFSLTIVALFPFPLFKRHRFGLAICILLSYFQVKSQSHQAIQAKIDSLRTQYIQATDDSLKLRNLTLMARELRYVNIDSSKFYLRKALALHGEKDVDKRTHVFAYNVIADIFRLESNIDSSIHYYEEAYQLFVNAEDPFPFLAIAPHYGKLLVEHNQAEKGINIFQEAIQIAISIEDNHNLSFIYSNLGKILYNVQKDNQRAKQVFFKGLATSSKGFDPNVKNDRINLNRVNSSFNLGLANVYLEEGKIDSSIFYANKAVVHALNVDYFQKAIIGYNLLCKSNIYLGQFDQAQKFNKYAFQYFDKTKDVKSIIQAKVLAIAIHQHFEEYSLCIAKGNQLLEVYSQILDFETKKEIYSQLFDAHLSLGNTTPLVKVKDSLLYYTHETYNLEHNTLLADMYDETLALENKILSLQQAETEKNLRTQKITGISLLVALLFAVAWAFTAYRSLKQKDKLTIHLEEMVAARTRELEKINEDLIQTNYELRSLGYVASHDLKEPILTIGSFAGLIHRKLPPELQASLGSEFNIIKQRTKQLSTLIEDFMIYINFSKVESLSLELVNVNEVIEDITEDLLSQEKYKNAHIETEGLSPLITNRPAMHFIFKNLIENGIKYNESIHPTVKISQTETQRSLQISVTDNGIGIAPEYTEEVFKMYKRLHNRSKYNGSGLGLSLVKVLSEKLNGSIELKSASNQGSQFIITLPKTPQTVYTFQRV